MTHPVQRSVVPFYAASSSWTFFVKSDNVRAVFSALDGHGAMDLEVVSVVA
jgi:hypothetical protein